ncbi:MAG: stage II sporulation protein M [Nanoarchaeota archaeon]|nr:stage II sporulation protein M [Nanoarchaeota archaeon]MBU1051212.1 stage II sporulation protein M [Nanoarchaeota archaeon]
MLEMLINPKKAERRPWEMFFIGAFYASLSVLLVNWVFAQDAVLNQRAGVLVVLFTVLFSIPFIYYTIRLEETKIVKGRGSWQLLKDHRRAIYAFLWLFVGFTVAFAFWYSILPSTQSFRAQIETYCMINRPGNFDECVRQYGIKDATQVTPFLTNKERLFLIFTNNMYVLLFTLVFSLIFGAGVIFILAWNASVIGAAIGIFTDYKLAALPIGILRFFLHGIFEIGSYFIIALAGGMVSVAIIRHETGTEKFWEVLQDSLNLIIVSVVILFAAALLEVFVTPLLF